MLNRIWIGFGFDNLVLNFFATFSSVTELCIKFAQCSFSLPSKLYILFIFGALTYYSVMQGTSLLSFVSCHQRGIRVTVIDTVPLLDPRSL